jgi:hypothetical protein
MLIMGISMGWVSKEIGGNWRELGIILCISGVATGVIEGLIVVVLTADRDPDSEFYRTVIRSKALEIAKSLPTRKCTDYDGGMKLGESSSEIEFWRPQDYNDHMMGVQ